MADSAPKSAPKAAPKSATKQTAPPPAARVESSSSEEESSSEDSSRPSTSSSESGSMPPPPQPRASTPPSATPAHVSAGVRTPGDRFDDRAETRSSRSASTASRSNRLSLTLPIAPPSAYPSRPIPASASVPSFPSTPIDFSSAAALDDPADLIPAIAAQERHVLEIREELSRAEETLANLKKQWANHEARKKRVDARRPEPMRAIPARTNTASVTSSPTASVEGSLSRRNSELDRRRVLLQGSQPANGEPNTPSRRRIFRGGHARALSLLSPTKTSPDDFPVREDQPDGHSIMSPGSSSQGVESPFLQNLGRYPPNTATHVSHRASWAPQSGHQSVTGAGLRQAAGELTNTLWNFVEDIRQAAVGEELANAAGAGGAPGAARNTDGGNDDAQNTIRAPNTATRPLASRAFGGDLQDKTAQASRNTSSEEPAAAKDKPAGKTSFGKSKAAKRFSWTPLSVDSFDDSDWTNWDNPTVAASPRWSGSTVNGQTDASPEQADENTTPQKRNSILSSLSPSASKNNELYAALNRLTPGNIKRTATDLMKEWEKSLSAPMDAHPGENDRHE